MDKIEKISEDVVNEILKIHKAYAEVERKISDRMNYIVHECVRISGGNIEWWSWQNGDYEDSHADGDFIHSYDKETIQINGELNHAYKSIFLTKDGSEWSLVDGYPTRWLFEDFEEEFTQGLQAYSDKRKQKALKTIEKNRKEKQKKRH